MTERERIDLFNLIETLKEASISYGLDMYNKEISEKIVNDCLDMMDNIRLSRNVCKEIVDRAREDKKVKDCDYSKIYEYYMVIVSRDARANQIVEEVVDINGGVKGYDTDIYMKLIYDYEEMITLNKEVNIARNKIRERYA